jgi:hypothetical protein
MIQITLTRRTLALVVAAFVAVAALAAGAFVRTAQADDKFNDVGTSTFFHDEISWLVDNGIANGFGSTFKPTENIKRQQAALWFSNYNDSLELRERTFDFDTTTTHAGAFASCPRGKRAVAGGHEGPGWPFVVARSVPVEFEGSWEWQVDLQTQPSAPIGAVTVWVLCVPEPIGTP